MVITGVWIAFGILTLLLVLMRINKSCGKNIASLICNILTVVISFVIARIFVNSTAVNVGKVFMEFIEQKYPLGASNLQSLGELMKFAGSIIAGVVMFYICYFIISFIMFIIKHLIVYRFFNKKENGNDEGNVVLEKLVNLISIVLSVSLTFMVLLTPLGFLYNSFNHNINNSDKKVPFVSNLYLDKLTEMPENENNVQTTNEIDYTLYAVNGIEKMEFLKLELQFVTKHISYLR